MDLRDTETMSGCFLERKASLKEGLDLYWKGWSKKQSLKMSYECGCLGVELILNISGSLNYITIRRHSLRNLSPASNHVNTCSPRTALSGTRSVEGDQSKN